MPLHPYTPPRGRLETFTLRSEAAAENRLGDPGDRLVHVYLPEGYDTEPSVRYPLFVALAGFTGSGAKLLSWQAFGENLPQRIDRLVAEGRMGKVVCVLPDCFTALGGNQYVNSPAMGRWADFLVQDLVPEVTSRYRIHEDRRARAVFGKSSGGYGALVQGMQHAPFWGAVACHSGDMGFEWCYLGDLPKALSVLDRHGGVEAFLTHVRATPRLRGEEFHILMTLAMAATYAPDPAAPYGVRLPVDPRTCELDVARWARWLDHDPVRMIRYPEAQENLRRLDGLFVDCGTRDEYNLVYGARQLHDQLVEAGVPHRYEEFDGGHSGIDHRMDVSLPFLYRAVTAADPYELGAADAGAPSVPQPAEACLDAPGEEAPVAVTRPSHPIPSQSAEHDRAPPGGVPGGCPKCRTEPMRQEVHGDVEIDRCPVCKGIFLDQGELERILEAEIGRSVDGGLTFTGVSEMMDEATAWCVRCGGEMGPVRTIAGVLLNVCDRCGTVFLDQGELAALELFRS